MMRETKRVLIVFQGAYHFNYIVDSASWTICNDNLEVLTKRRDKMIQIWKGET